MGKHHVKDWHVLLEQAAAIVNSYASITLRQLFYQLVSRGLLLNKQTAYNTLSNKSAEARREGWFPALVDRTRGIQVAESSDDPHHALQKLVSGYRRDRAEGQEWNVYIGVEKDALSALLWNWFAKYGVKLLVLKGYASQSFCDEVNGDIHHDGRPAVLLYGGDRDPHGDRIEDDFSYRVGAFDEVIRVALTSEQVAAYGLPAYRGDQVELDALPPDTLENLFMEAFGEYFDMEQWERVKEQEDKETTVLDRVFEMFEEAMQEDDDDL